MGDRRERAPEQGPQRAKIPRTLGARAGACQACVCAITAKRRKEEEAIDSWRKLEN